MYLVDTLRVWTTLRKVLSGMANEPAEAETFTLRLAKESVKGTRVANSQTVRKPKTRLGGG